MCKQASPRWGGPGDEASYVKTIQIKTQFFESVSFHCSTRKLTVLSSALCVAHLSIEASSIILLERMEKETYISNLTSCSVFEECVDSDVCTDNRHLLQVNISAYNQLIVNRLR